MSSIKLSTLVQQVEALVSNGSAAPASTGDATLDAALADLREDYSDTRPIDVMNFWNG
jgi:hypothetical protein